MKWFRILSHPYTLIICFLLIMISGESFGGFYAMYILMALPFGGMHALLAVAGILVLIINHSLNTNRTGYRLASVSGLFLLIASLLYFFSADKQHYNWGSFEQVVPVITMILTAVISIFFLVGNFNHKKSPEAYNGTVA